MTQDGIVDRTAGIVEIDVDAVRAVPGTTMMITVPSASDRADIIAYLKTIDAP
jgi:hypothetical protein